MLGSTPPNQQQWQMKVDSGGRSMVVYFNKIHDQDFGVDKTFMKLRDGA